MSIIQEWREWHLTPMGWVAGSYLRHDGSTGFSASPADRVLTCTYKIERNAYGQLAPYVQESWSCGDENIIEPFRVRYGPCPQQVG